MGVKVISKAIIQLSPSHYFWHFSLLFPFWKRTKYWVPIKDIIHAALWTLNPLHTHKYDYCFQNVQRCCLMVSDITQRRTSPSALPLKSLIKLLQWSRGHIAYTDIKWVMALQGNCHIIKFSINSSLRDLSFSYLPYRKRSRFDARHSTWYSVLGNREAFLTKLVAVFL